jgi:transposase
MWCIPEVTEEFEERMMDVLKQYGKGLHPHYPRVCLDEKSQQLLSTPGGERLTGIGKASRVDYEYQRHGTVNCFVAIEPKAGRRTIRVTGQRTGKDFAKFTEELVMKVYKRARKVHLILDNLNTHNEKTLLEYLGGRGKEVAGRIIWHYTPKHASWLNQAEIEIGVLTRQVLRKRIATKEALIKEAWAYQERRNEEKATINWRFTGEMARKKFNLH